MNIVSPERFSQRDYQSLRAFLDYCRADAREAGAPRLANISIEVDHIDPLAVLHAVFEPREHHFYSEKVAEGAAVAAAEAVLQRRVSGRERFAEAAAFRQEVLDSTIAIGDLSAPMTGPNLFFGFAFQDEPEDGSAFAPGTLFVPRWQVAAKDDRFTAVANAVVTPDADLDYLAERIWAAHEKFKSFDYGTASAEPGERISFHDDPEEQAQFRETVSFALERIRRGELEKVVPARVLDAEIETEFRPFESLYRLRERFSGCTVFSFSDGSPACFLGATPERLIRLESGILRTEAIAGTRPRGFSPGEDAQLGQELLRSDKDLREHRAVIGALSERLRSLGLQPGFRAMPRLLRLRNVQHLVTSIRAEAGGLAFFDAVAALHPTPAIGGAPRDASREFIREQEEFPRGLFTGALGWVDAHNGGEAFVGIRAALAEGTRLRLYGGAGIVAGSDPQQEDEEVTAKLRALRDIFEKQQG